MQVTSLFEEFDKLQSIHGDKDLDSIYGCGEINNPSLCLVFMNPTAKMELPQSPLDWYKKYMEK